jgi:hypothetical protein
MNDNGVLLIIENEGITVAACLTHRISSPSSMTLMHVLETGYGKRGIIDCYTCHGHGGRFHAIISGHSSYLALDIMGHSR